MMAPRSLFALLMMVMLCGTGCAALRTANDGESESERNNKETDEIENIKVTNQSSNRQPTLPQAPQTAEYHFGMAQAYSADGETDRAIEEYKLTLMYDPQSALVWTRLCTEYAKKGTMSIAMESCKEATKQDAKYTDAHLILAGLNSLVHENDAAIAEYDEVLKYDPKNEEAVSYKAQVLIESDQAQLASQSLKKFLKANPESATAWYMLGRAESVLDHFEESVKALRTATDLHPGFVQAALSLAYAYESRDMNEQAIKVYQNVFDDSQDARAAARISTIYLKKTQYQNAVPYLESIQATDPGDLNNQLKLGLVYMELKKYESAKGIFTGLLSKDPESDRIHYYLANLYGETGDVASALEHFGKIEPDSSLFEDATLQSAYLYRASGKPDMARDHIRVALKKFPKASSFYILSASFAEEDSQLAEATVILESATQRFPADEKILYYLGSLYDRQGRTDDGVTVMQEILKTNPDNADALNFIGYSWTTQGTQLAQAERMIRRAVELKPDNGFIRDSWGWYLFTVGKISASVVELEKAVGLAPNEATIIEHLADAYHRSNLWEKALARYRQAIPFAKGEIRERITSKANNLERVLAENGRTTGGTASSRSPAADTVLNTR